MNSETLENKKVIKSPQVFCSNGIPILFSQAQDAMGSYSR